MVAGMYIIFLITTICSLRVILSYQDHCQLYPTLARIALDILPLQASSVPCERLFSASKQTADDRRARLGAERFEELQIMKFAWRNTVPDLAAWNSAHVEHVNAEEFGVLLHADEMNAELDGSEDEMVIDYLPQDFRMRLQ
jgi:hypothetical protein